MRHTLHAGRAQRFAHADPIWHDDAHSRLRAAMVELQRARCALSEICHAVTAAEALLELKRREREDIALQVAALAERVEVLESALGGK